MNRYTDHVYVIPEDRADRQIAQGFVEHEAVDHRRVQIASEAGGWRAVLHLFETEYIARLNRDPLARVVLLIDFDDQGENRRVEVQHFIPDHLKDRVFLLGPKCEPKDLKAAMGNKPLDQIGRDLANDCAAGTSGLWDHPQLAHNKEEQLRLVQTIRPFVFRGCL